MTHNTWIYIAIMAVVTYLIRMLPLTLLRKEIKNRTLRSCLYYVPYVTLTVMTFPAIIHATGSMISGSVGMTVALVLGWRGKNLPIVAFFSCIAVLVTELLLQFFPALHF